MTLFFLYNPKAFLSADYYDEITGRARKEEQGLEEAHAVVKKALPLKKDTRPPPLSEELKDEIVTFTRLSAEKTEIETKILSISDDPTEQSILREEIDILDLARKEIASKILIAYEEEELLILLLLN